MKIGDPVWIPRLRTYGRIHEINWDRKRIKTVEIIDPVTSLPKIINVINLVVEAVGLIEQLVLKIIALFRKPGDKQQP